MEQQIVDYRSGQFTIESDGNQYNFVITQREGRDPIINRVYSETEYTNAIFGSVLITVVLGFTFWFLSRQI